MCGICGFLTRGAAPDAKTVKSMAGTLAHRGPDGEGVHLDPPVALGHRRLSIIDLSEAASEPMTNEDGTLWLVFNGEIYNFRELRTQLDSEDHTFVTRSDTEVLLRLGTASSLDWVSRLNGMFAFGLWAEGDRRLILGRDRLGIKPLFYAALDHAFVFASEIKALPALVRS